jgi:AraC-like DNA-binding protein
MSQPVWLPEHPGQAARIVARERHRVATLMVREDALVMVVKGCKTLVSPAGELTVPAGALVLMPRGTQCDVINDPAGNPRYEALALVFGDALVRHHEAALQGAGSPPQGVGLASVRGLLPQAELADAIGRACSTLHNPRSSAVLRTHRLLEVLILLSEQGVRFKPGHALSWHDRIRRVVSQRPHEAWDVAQIAAAMNLSVSSLRRRLAAEQAVGQRGGVSALVREVRLEVALGLLQTTRLPVGEVAQRCGWTSHSRFTEAFQTRWGFAPSLLRSPVSRKGE